MRIILFFGLILLGTITYSQAPQYLNYQAVARDAGGSIITTAIGIKFEILQGSISGTLVYEETHAATPSAAGIFTAHIGGGSVVSGNFNSIGWGSGPYFLKVSIDPTGGTSYSTLGASELVSVPYALFAEKAGNVTNYNAGNGIAITSGSIINTSPGQTVNINQSGIANVLGLYPNYTVDVPNPTLNYNSFNQILSLTQGTAVTTATITSSSTSVSITGPGVSGTYPNYTITPPPATSITAGNSNITVTGAEPSFTISSVPQLTVVGNQLSISNGNSVTIPTGTTYTNGPGISLSSGTIITNTAPDQTVVIGNGTNMNVTGTYPNFVVNATPTLALNTNTLSISGGNSVVINMPNPPIAGPGISIVSGTISNTAMNQTVNVSGTGVLGTYPNYTVTSAPSTSVSSGSSNVIVTGSVPSYSVIVLNPVISGAGTTTVTSAGNNYTVNTPPVNLGFVPSTGILSYTPASGTNTINITPNVTFGSNILTVGANTISIPGTGVWTRPTATATALSNISDFVGIGTSNPTAKLEIVSNSFNLLTFSTTAANTNVNVDAYPNGTGNLYFRVPTANGISFATSNTDRMRIDPTGNVGIGISSPNYPLQVQKSTAGTFVSSIENTGASGWGLEVRTASTSSLQSAFEIYTGGLNKFQVRSDGFVGINTSAPSTKLHLSGTNTSTIINSFSASPETAIRIHNDDLTNNSFSSIIFSTRSTSASNYESAKIVGVNANHTAGSIGGDLVFMTREPANILERMRITSNGNIGIRTQNPTAELEVNGFTKLGGSTAPAIKILKLTGTTNAVAGNGATILHGLTMAKILSVVVMVEASATQWIPPTWGYAGYEYRWDLGTTSVNIWTTGANSANVLNKPIRVLITYEQ